MAETSAAVGTQDVNMEIVAGQPVGQDTFWAGEPAQMQIALGVPVAEDTYFAGEPGIIGTFDFDYQKIVFHETNKACVPILCCVWMPPAWCCLPCFVYHMERHVAAREQAKHVALTRDGIWYVVEGYEGKCIPDFREKQSTLIRYDTIRQCRVQEPGRNVCCCIEDLPRVIIESHDPQGVSSPAATGSHRQALSLRGLKHYREFERTVSAMQRGEMLTGTPPPTSLSAVARVGDTPVAPNAEPTPGRQNSPPARTLGRALDSASESEADPRPESTAVSAQGGQDSSPAPVQTAPAQQEMTM